MRVKSLALVMLMMAACECQTQHAPTYSELIGIYCDKNDIFSERLLIGLEGVYVRCDAESGQMTQRGKWSIEVRSPRMTMTTFVDELGSGVYTIWAVSYDGLVAIKMDEDRRFFKYKKCDIGMCRRFSDSILLPVEH